MKTAIIYVSKYGTTEKVAIAISEKISPKNEIQLISLKQMSNPDIARFERVILGVSIYAGQASKRMKEFCKTNENLLLEKTIGLFVCGMDPNKEKQETELKEAYPEQLLKNAIATGFMGGEFIFEKMNFLERLIIKKIAKTNSSVNRINWETIDEFVKKIALIDME